MNRKAPTDVETERCFGSIDFEETNFEQARAALEQPPAGVQAIQREDASSWEQRRRAPDQRDAQVSQQAGLWLERLPHELRPSDLASRYPRLANHLAEVWNNGPVCLALLDGLLVDHRGARRGFPSNVALELVALRDYRAAVERRHP